MKKNVKLIAFFDEDFNLSILRVDINDPDVKRALAEERAWIVPTYNK